MQVIHYTIVLHNTGNVDLTGVSVTDPFADPGSLQFVGGDTNNDGKLDPTETWTYSATHTVTQQEINAGRNLMNTAFGDTDQTGPKDDSATTTVSQNPDFSIAKDATESSVDHAGQVIHYTIVLHNTGNVDLTGVSVTDPFADPGSLQFVGGDTNNNNTLELTEIWTYSATHTVSQQEMNAGQNLINTAFADTDQTGPKNDDATTTVSQNPDFSIAKDATESSVNHAGQVIHYSIVLHNTGNVDLTGVSVTDPFADPGSLQFVGGDTNNNNTLELTEIWTYSATHTVTQQEMNAGANLVNTAFADTDQTGPKDDNATTTVSRNPDLTIAKDAQEASVSQAGQIIHYTIVVTNTGNVDLTGVTIDDPFADAIPGVVLFSGDLDNDNILDTTETWTYTAQHTVTQAEITAGGNLVNTATVTTDQTPPKNDDATSTILATQLTVKDQLISLPPTADGMVAYTAYHSLSDCQTPANGVPAGGGFVTFGSAPFSGEIVVGPGTSFGETVWFTATFTPGGGGDSLTTGCTEMASTSP